MKKKEESVPKDRQDLKRYTNREWCATVNDFMKCFKPVRLNLVCYENSNCEDCKFYKVNTKNTCNFFVLPLIYIALTG